MRSPVWKWSATLRVRWGDWRAGVSLDLDRWRGHSLTVQLPILSLKIWRKLK